ncbi:MAG TPA: HAD family hydrolase, partial [Thermoanaerobaculia bacterium]|nr:HAD family hydrolase [Thermoanaerobaculia bacterium]
LGGAAAAAAWIAAGSSWSIAVLAAAGVFLAAAPAGFIAASALPVRGAMERLAAIGVAIRGGRTLDRMRAVGTIATNIRGGVCIPRARVAEVVVLGGTPVDGLLGAAAAAAPADHPLGALLRQRAGSSPQERPEVSIGTAEQMSGRGIAMAAIAEDVARFEAEGKAVLAVADGPRLLGAVTIAFDERPGATETIEWLNQRGLRTVLLTRHDAGTAAALMARFGFSASESGLERPFDSTLVGPKNAKLRAWISTGDDEDSAERADVAIAFGDTADRTPHGDAIITTGSFDSLRRLIEEADRAQRSAAARSRWLLAYHLVALPVAGGALLPLTGLLPSPFLAALGSLAALTLSSLPARRAK